jgi:hypothetical protein
MAADGCVSDKHLQKIEKLSIVIPGRRAAPDLKIQTAILNIRLDFRVRAFAAPRNDQRKGA